MAGRRTLLEEKPPVDGFVDHAFGTVIAPDKYGALPGNYPGVYREVRSRRRVARAPSPVAAAVIRRFPDGGVPLAFPDQEYGGMTVPILRRQAHPRQRIVAVQ